MAAEWFRGPDTWIIHDTRKIKMDPPGLMLQQIELSVYWYPDGLLIVGKERKHRKQYRDGILPPQCKSRWGGSRYTFNDGYQAMVGSLMYAMLYTCPDLVYAVQQLLRFNSNPVNTHFKRQNESFDTFRALK